jgi:hypothetical protein
MDVGFLDHRGQCLLGHAPRFQKAWEVAALAKLRDPQLDGARAGLPVTVAEAVALIDAFGGAFAVAGTAECVGFQRHQSLRGEADHLTQPTGVGGLLQKLLKGDLVVGHRGVSLGQSCESQPNSTQPHRGDRRCG